MTPESAIALVFGFATLGGVVVIVSGMRHRARILEMAHRERLAMIERGITPPPGLMCRSPNVDPVSIRNGA